MSTDVIIAVWLAFSIVNAGAVFRYIYLETSDAWYAFQVMMNALPLCMYGPAATLGCTLGWLLSRPEK